MACSGADETLVYDADGNLTAAGGSMGASTGRAVTWDAENRLIRVEPSGTPTNGDEKVEFEYDYMNRRVSKKVSSYNGSTWSVDSHLRFIYHNWLELLELDAQDSNVVETKWTWGLDIAGQRGQPDSIDSAAGISGLLACLDTQGTSSTGDDKSYAYFYDANGNVGQLVDTSDGSFGARYEYDAYGNVTFSDGAYASENKIRFSTKYWDDETGLGNWGYRYYDPLTGRWTSRDPIGEAGGLPAYCYAMCAPTTHEDALGLSSRRHPGLVCDVFGPVRLCDPISCEAACAESDARALTVCMDGFPCVCLCDERIDREASQPTANRIMRGCLARHEFVHVTNSRDDCAGRAHWENDDECVADQVHLRCIRENSYRCRGNRECLEQLRNWAATTDCGPTENQEECPPDQREHCECLRYYVVRALNKNLGDPPPQRPAGCDH